VASRSSSLHFAPPRLRSASRCAVLRILSEARILTSRPYLSLEDPLSEILASSQRRGSSVAGRPYLMLVT
jgi:hypothetical protein